MYKVEKGIPVKRPLHLYPFRDMEVGDSFAFPMEDYRKIISNAQAYRRGRDVRFAVRKIDDETGRCWRVE